MASPASPSSYRQRLEKLRSQKPASMRTVVSSSSTAASSLPPAPHSTGGGGRKGVLGVTLNGAVPPPPPPPLQEEEDNEGVPLQKKRSLSKKKKKKLSTTPTFPSKSSSLGGETNGSSSGSPVPPVKKPKKKRSKSTKSSSSQKQLNGGDTTGGNVEPPKLKKKVSASEKNKRSRPSAAASLSPKPVARKASIMSSSSSSKKPRSARTLATKEDPSVMMRDLIRPPPSLHHSNSKPIPKNSHRNNNNGRTARSISMPEDRRRPRSTSSTHRSSSRRRNHPDLHASMPALSHSVHGTTRKSRRYHDEDEDDDPAKYRKSSDRSMRSSSGRPSSFHKSSSSRAMVPASFRSRKSQEILARHTHHGSITTTTAATPRSQRSLSSERQRARSLSRHSARGLPPGSLRNSNHRNASSSLTKTPSEKSRLSSVSSDDEDEFATTYGRTSTISIWAPKGVAMEHPDNVLVAEETPSGELVVSEVSKAETRRPSFQAKLAESKQMRPHQSAAMHRRVIDAFVELKKEQKVKRRLNRELEKYHAERVAKAPLLVIWILVGAELGLDFGTTIISFQKFFEEDNCCDEPIDLGNLPLGITIPFFFLICLELLLLFLNIRSTLFPKCLTCNRTKEADLTDEERIEQLRTRTSKSQRFMASLNCVVILNPFFGFLVSWLLLYQSSREECFLVLGLESGALFLHFLCIWLENHNHSCVTLTVHSAPLIPFLVLVSLIFWYLSLGGVCYVGGRFWYEGCLVCGDGLPPPSGFDKCNPDYAANSTQGTWCGGTPEENFCWFSYDG